MRILVVEDDRALARGLLASLKAEGWAVDHVGDGESALIEEASEPYAGIILDVGLPDVSGFEVLRRLRGRGSRTPVMILTARDTLQDKIVGLDLGADDYLLKPFDLGELSARVRALVRRGTGGDPSPVLTVGNLVVDRSRHEARLDGQILDLRPREWTVLEILAIQLGQLVSRETLSGQIFGHDDPVGPNALDVHVGRLRRKLQPDGPDIRTIRGRGYILSC